MSNKRYQPFHKQVLRIRKNIQNRLKLFRFNKQKWKKLQRYSRRQLTFTRRFRIKDQYQLTVSKFAGRGNSFRRKFKNNLLTVKTIKLFYGNIKQSTFKNIISKAKTKGNMTRSIVDYFECRLDTVLYRSNFSSSIGQARQLILHKHILVNGHTVSTCHYTVGSGDIVQIQSDPSIRKMVRKNIDMANFWPIPPKHFVINYKTLQLTLADNCVERNTQPIFNHHLKIQSLTITL